MSSYFDYSADQLNKIVILLTTVVLVSLAGFRQPGVDRDSLQYVHLILNEQRPLMEPTFKFLSQILKSTFSNPILPFFLIYAVLGITLKMYAIQKLSDFWMLSVVIYISYSFTLHDLTQIRTGVAVGFVLLSLPSIYERNFIIFLAFIALASLFHYSAVIMLILWLFKPLTINRWIYFALLVASYVLIRYFETAMIYVFSFLPEVFQARALNYDGDFDGELNIFNTWQLMRCVISIVFLIYANKLLVYNKYALLLIKFYIVGTASYVLLASNPTFSGRFSDIFFVFDILSLPLIVYIFRYQPIGKLVVIIIGCTYVFMNLYYNKIIN
ncbi:EpsG family protein [Dyadobacter sp. 32]|uniref:EpsG family protein n=1 Tax=Dyadobacter sp. 32 TaxID=538966 RepID=UPI0039C6C4DE